MQISKIFIFLFIAFLSQAAQKAKAQIKPDGTLGSEGSVINSIDELRSLVEGGATRGSNLFHSFSDFNIGEGSSVYFANPEGIANIFSRVTGNSISEILGTLGVEGTANLFFMNPNGIVFGENAFVDVGGSFIATTANTIEFSDGQTFSARDENQKPLLTWNAPIGLGLDNNSGEIVVKGIGHNLLVTPERLLVSDDNLPSARTEISTGEGFALLGNGVVFDGGVLDIKSEKIDIGSVEQGKISFTLSPQLEFNYSQVEKFADINLDNFSLIDIDGNEAKTANFEGNLIELKNGSFILFRKTEDIASNLQQTININSREQLLLRGSTENIPLSPERLSRGITGIISQNFAGDAIDINITTKNLILKSGGAIGSLSNLNHSENLSGVINVNATKSVTIDGFIPSNATLGFSNIGSGSFDEAESHLIKIDTENLSIINGGTIASIGFGSGINGDIDINAKESVLVDGVIGNNNVGVAASQIANNTLGNGKSGLINIRTLNLSVLNGASIGTASFSKGSAGNVFIEATNSIKIDGFAEQEILDEVNNFSSINSLVSRLNPAFTDANPILPTTPLPTGDAGNISLTTGNLTISNTGSITVQNDGLGNSGTIEINADNLNLDRTASINAAAAFGAGGNISIATSDLNISSDSQITAIAGGVLPGGNITIDTINLSANNNNQITASAAQGEGGNITINAQDSLTLNNGNSIAAASESGDGGNLELTTDQLQIRDNSNISTSAQGLGDGGNITISADNVLVINDSDVTASAIQGDGGNIRIEADSVLGIEERPAIPGNGTSDADASSEFGSQGTVEIINPIQDNDNPLLAIRQPDFVILDRPKRECGPGKQRRLATVTGNAFPRSPYDFADNEEIKPPPGFVPPEEEEPEADRPWKPGDPVVDSNAVRIDENGDVWLVAILEPEKVEDIFCKPYQSEEEQESIEKEKESNQ